MYQIAYNAHLYNDRRNPGIPPLADQLLELCDNLLDVKDEELTEAEAGIEYVDNQVKCTSGYHRAPSLRAFPLHLTWYPMGLVLIGSNQSCPSADQVLEWLHQYGADFTKSEASIEYVDQTIR